MTVTNVKVAALGISFLFAVSMKGEHLPAVGLCNTGLTPASAFTGCTTSVPVTPLNPETGGSSVDGNWQIASPYPSAPYYGQAPDPCALKTFVPAWVDTPPAWFNPIDGLSQYISPLSIQPSVGGWYVYRTTMPVPASLSGARYTLSAAGKMLVDDQAAAIAIENPAGNPLGCKVAVLPSLTVVASGGPGTGTVAWNPFEFAATVTPGTDVYVYVVVFNVGNPNDSQNGTGLRIEFTSAYLTPE